MEFWRFRECVMHSAAAQRALLAPQCVTRRSEPQWSGSVPVVVSVSFL